MTQSKAPWHEFTFYVPQYVSNAQLMELRTRFRAFCKAHLANDLAADDVYFVLDSFNEYGSIKIVLWMASYFSFADFAGKYRVYNVVMLGIRAVMKEMGIHFVSPAHKFLQEGLSLPNNLGGKPAPFNAPQTTGRIV